MTKNFFKSKTVLIALVSMGLAILGFFTNRDIPAGTASEIISLNWIFPAQAILSALAILVRVYFPSSAKLSSIWDIFKK